MDKYRGTYIMIGPPGTGKTRTLAGIVRKIMAGEHSPSNERSPVLICSLTVTAAQEIASRVHLPEAAVATIHAHALRSMVPRRNLISKALLEEFNQANPGFAVSALNNKMDPLDGTRSNGFPGDEYLHEYDLARNRLEEPTRHAVKRFAERWQSFKREHDVIDYTDMLALAGDEPPMMPKYLIVDEAQDTSALAFQVLQQWAKECLAVFYVGDPWQCLYEWAGAHPQFLIDEDVEATRAVLAQSYRIPAKVHERAVKWVSKLSDYAPIEYAPRRENPSDPESPVVEGFVETINCTWQSPGKLFEHAKGQMAEGRSVMFVTSANYMADSLAKRMKEKGIVFWNPWRQSNATWNPLTPAKGVSTLHRIACFLKDGWTVEDVLTWAPLVKGVFKRGAKVEMQKLPLKATVTEARVHAWFDEAALTALSACQNPAEDLKWLSERLCAGISKRAAYPLKVAQAVVSVPFWSVDELLDLKPQCFVGTCHSFKGAEADVVYVFPDLTRAAMDEMLHKCSRDSIIRTFYVALTRARVGVVLAGSSTRNRVFL